MSYFKKFIEINKEFQQINKEFQRVLDEKEKLSISMTASQFLEEIKNYKGKIDVELGGWGDSKRYVTVALTIDMGE